EDALEQYKIAARLKPEAAEIAVTLAGLYEATERPDSAIAILMAEVERSGAPGARHGLASLLTRRRHWPEAMSRYREILVSDSTDLKALYSLGLLFEVQEQRDSAIAYFDRASAQQPANTSIRRRIFNALLAQKDFTSAIMEADDILEIEPDDANLRLQLARIYYRQQDFSNAADQFQELLGRDSANTEALYTLARLRFQQKRYDDAARYFRRSLRILPKLDEAWVNLGVCQLQAGQADSAEQSFKQARKRGNKMDMDYLFGFGYSQLEQYDKAIPYYLKAYPKRKKDASFLFNLAAACERAGDFYKSEQYFKELLQRDPGHASAQNYLGYMYADKGVNLDQAKTLIAQALQKEPDNAYYIDSMGWVYFRLGQLAEAQASIERAVSLMPGDATLRDHLGDVYLAQGDRAKAIEQWKKALELDPKKEETRKKIDENKHQQ
ncbi:MAG: tetratricopeptide repeat protein, partial [Candidatus Edwardsbacteria bacterium]|nr:tetratricopeptide repeat protein [Candidatus Edwardsbacteria bacterium]